MDQHAVAYMFPGQGAQYKGMGETLLTTFPEETQKASLILGYDLMDLCLNDPDGRLNHTQYTQPAIYFVSCLAYLRQLSQSAPPAFVLGHSVGEYAALFAASVFDLYTGLRIVQKRGQLMAGVEEGGMLAVIGDQITTLPTLLEAHDLHAIDIANFNSFKQIVLSGPKEALVVAKNILEQQLYRCIPLPVSGAFHSRYMEPVRIAFMQFLVNFEFNNPRIPLITPTAALPLETPYIVETLGLQLVKSVQWMQSILYLRNLAVRQFIELGPGNVLSRLNRQIL